MSNRRYHECRPRDTVQLLPPCLDDDVGSDNPVRAMDDKGKLIVATALVQDGNDSHQRETMMMRASEAMGSSGLTGLADQYHLSIHLKAV